MSRCENTRLHLRCVYDSKINIEMLQSRHAGSGRPVAPILLSLPSSDKTKSLFSPLFAGKNHTPAAK